MIRDQFILDLHNEIIVDLFAGGGGASTGIEAALGRHVDIAVNHDPQAVSVHTVNHPQTQHYCSDVFEVDPASVAPGRPIGLLWASPDCKHFSKAKGGKPVSKRVRGLAWVVVQWAAKRRPRVIILENVEEFVTWGPLGADDRPCPQRKGETFRAWVDSLRALGYRVERRELRGCDYGAPTIRKRLFVIARRDGQPIVWPAPTHAKPDARGKTPPGMKPWRTEAECIDWSIPCPSIFERARPLADATCRRIAKGIMRYVVGAAQPFIVPLRGTSPQHTSTHGIDQPLSTISAGGTHHALVAPTLVSIANWSSDNIRGTDAPLSTVTANPKGGHHALVTAFLARHYTGVVGSALREPIGTVTSVDHHSIVAAHLVHMGHGEQCRDGRPRWSDGTRDIAAPLNTVTASSVPAALVQAFLIKYYGNEVDGLPVTEPLHTIPTRDRFGLVLVHGQPYQIVDIGLRMLTPRELYRAQGFPPSYVIDRGAAGEPITKTAQVRMCGNSVCPPLATALVRSNCAELIEYTHRAMEAA